MADPKDARDRGVAGASGPSSDANRRDEPKNPSRRDAIRYLIGGAVAAACPMPHVFAASQSSAATPQSASSSGPGSGAAHATLGSESNEICHRVRDGEE